MRDRDKYLIGGLALLLVLRRCAAGSPAQGFGLPGASGGGGGGGGGSGAGGGGNRGNLEPIVMPKELPGGIADKFAEAWATRASQLNRRAAEGLRWADRFAAILGNAPVGLAASRWAGIESSGDPRKSSTMNERGLAQVSKGSLKDLGLTEADYNAMASAQTTDDAHAALAAKVMLGEALGVARLGARGPSPGWGPPIGPMAQLGGKVLIDGLGIAKLRHGLPLLVRELHVQGHLRSSIPLTIRSALLGSESVTGPKPRYTPSKRAAAFATKVTGDPAADLLLRFLCSAAVVAHGELAIPMGAAAKGL